MKSGRVVFTAFLASLLILGFFLIPLPVTRIREYGLVQFHPEYISQVFVTNNAVLTKIHVKEGEHVVKGTLLAEFENLDLDKQKIETQGLIATKEAILELYKRKRNEAQTDSEKVKLGVQIANTLGELNSAREKMRGIDKDLKDLRLYANRAGVVLGLPNIDELGRAWEAGQDAPFCSIGDRSKLRVLVPVHPSDMEVMRDNFFKLGEQKPIPVTIRVQGRVGSLWKGGVWMKELPKSEASEIPLPLSSKGGGHIAVRPPTANQKLIPQAQIYLVPVDFEDPDEAVCTSAMAQVKIHCEYESAAWWTWRTISSIFDLGLVL